MIPLSLYCKSYATDLRRLVRLAHSIREHNVEHLPFYVSVPKQDLSLFQDHLNGLCTQLLTDENILEASPRINPAQVAAMPGSVSQQVIKSEFWRLGLSTSYLCVDSDAIFIRPFGVADFLLADGTPYTVMHESKELMMESLRRQRERILIAFNKEADQVQALFHRQGRRYDFGPFPLVWHCSVWDSLDKNYLEPKGMSFADAIQQAPSEARWYTEALLAYKAIPLMPCQAFFKVYHYAWQFDRDRRDGLSLDQLSKLYCGVIFQSAWEREMDYPAEGGSLLSKLARRIRRHLGRA
jgi:Family of unknown function (DUF6492)